MRTMYRTNMIKGRSYYQDHDKLHNRKETNTGANSIVYNFYATYVPYC